MRITFMQILFVLCVNVPEQMIAQGLQSESTAIITPQNLKMLVGDWKGSLTYIDYTSNQPYTLPANLSVKPGKNEWELLLDISYPNEPKANGKDKIKVSKHGRQLNKRDVVAKEIMADGRVQIVTEFFGKDNRKSALIRNIYILGEKQFIMRKEVQFENSDQWLQRNEYNYRR